MDTSSLSKEDDEVGVFFKFHIDDYEYKHRGWQTYWITPHNVKLLKEHPYFDKSSIEIQRIKLRILFFDILMIISIWWSILILHGYLILH